jgi:hypothetical protein
MDIKGMRYGEVEWIQLVHCVKGCPSQDGQSH